jgi:putative membrane protein
MEGEVPPMMDGWGMTLGSWIWMLVWIGALVLMVWLVVAGWRGERHEDPLELLRARYARGEISENEYRHARGVLTELGAQR